MGRDYVSNKLDKKSEDEIRGQIKDPLTRKILEEFALICRIPHSSGHEERLEDYIIDRLKSRGLGPIRDKYGNLICDIPAKGGHADAPVTVIQGHLDMVCAVAEGSDYDPLNDAIHWEIKGNLLVSDGRSSLGADCGMGNSVVLALMDSGEFAHGPLRLIFTVKEEIGLEGAKTIEKKYFDDVKYVINVDGFKEGRVIIGSAGGRRESFSRDLKTLTLEESIGRVEPGAEQPVSYELILTGFQGGHSGYDINKGRGNSIKLMGLFLSMLTENGIDFRVSKFKGGETHNSIPRDAHLQITIADKDEKKFRELVEKFRSYIKEKYSKTDKNGKFLCLPSSLPKKVWRENDRRAVQEFINNIFNGVYKESEEIEDTVDASANIGKIDVDESGHLEVLAFIRSLSDSAKKPLVESHMKIAERTGFEVEASEYPSWKYDKKNELAKTMQEAYKEETGGKLKIAAEHVGLEPSAFAEKNPNLVMVNTGPDIINPHAVTERVLIDSLSPYAGTLRRTLELLAEKEDHD